jgi:hypothetical protein
MHDQTDPSWLRDSNPQDLGTGIFLVPDVISDEIGAVRRVIVPDLTHQQCERRGAFTPAFKWVPQWIASVEVIQRTDCHGDCTVLTDEPGCLCLLGKTR